MDAGSEPAHLVALPVPPPGAPEQVIVPETRPVRPEDDLPRPIPGSTPQETSDKAAKFIDSVMPLAMQEANIFSLCYDAAQQIVVHHQKDEMRDAIAIGDSFFQPGSRTPLQNAVPQIATEIYKNVRAEMREQAKKKRAKK